MKNPHSTPRCTFKISVTLLQMEDVPKIYSMILRRPWVKQAKAHHDWGNNTLTIIVDTKIITISTLKKNNGIPLSKTLQFG